jgi:acetyl-CoA decarbonylase/synthase complex subunit beta
MFEDIPVEVGLVHEGERIRKQDMQVELGGPKVKEKFELVRVCPVNEIVNGRITVAGLDIPDLEEAGSFPLGILVKVGGFSLEEDLEGVVERRIHEYSNYIQGFMHLNQRYDIWVRISKKSYRAGFNTLKLLGKVLQELFVSELPIIEAMEITFFTDPERVRDEYYKALAIYEARDTRARGLLDEDVDVFYGCALCQSFAPSHVCVITPQRYANCGAISWFDGRAAARMDPKGPIFPIEKGSCKDPVKGEYTGVNESAAQRSMGEVDRVYLYSGFDFPHTSCGCFEAIAFYIPEVEGFGIVHRGFRAATPNGLPFSTLADSTAGGRQVDGFHGISIEYLRSPKFMQGDGGFSRVVWMPAEIKEKVRDFIPGQLQKSIATETDATTVPELKAFLSLHEHPVVASWIPEEAASSNQTLSGMQPVFSGDLPLSAGGFRIILKNARITAEKVIIIPPKQGGKDNGGRRIG